MGSRILSRSFNIGNHDRESDEDEEDEVQNGDSKGAGMENAMDVDTAPNENIEDEVSGAEAAIEIEDDSDDEDEDAEDPADIAMLPMADMLNARYECENVSFLNYICLRLTRLLLHFGLCCCELSRFV